MAYWGNEPAKVAVKVGANVITTAEIQDGQVYTADILDDAITAQKVDDDGTGFRMGSLGLGAAVSGSEKLTVGGTASFSGAITGNLTGNASGTAATVTTAAQPNITSLGTLSALAVTGTSTFTGSGDFVRANSNASNANCAFALSNQTTLKWSMYNNASDNSWNLYDHNGSANAITVATGGNATFAGATTINTSDSEQLMFKGATSPYLRFYESTTAKAYMQWHSDGYLNLENSEASTNLAVGANGIGIGTTSPSGELHIKSAASSHADLIIDVTTDDYASGLYYYEAGSAKSGIIHYGDSTNGVEGGLQFLTGGTSAASNTRMVIDSSGNVGIGCTPGDILEIDGTNPILKIGNRIRIKADESNATAWYGVGSSLNNFKFGDADFGSAIAEINLSAGQAAFKVVKDTNAYAGYFENDNGQAQGIHIKCKSNDSGQTGRYLIKAQGYGSSGAFTDNFLLDIDGNATFAGNIEVTGRSLLKDIIYGESTYGFRFYRSDLGVQNVRFYDNGDYSFRGSDASDKDLKKNIADIPDGSLALVNQLKPKTYKWKVSQNVGDTTKTGFIAQDVAEVFGTNESVATGTDGNQDMGIDPTGIIAHLTKAVQELSAKVIALENA